MIFIGYDYELNLSVVIFYDFRTDQILFTAFKELFKLRICVKKKEEKAKTMRAENFRKIG